MRCYAIKSLPLLDRWNFPTDGCSPLAGPLFPSFPPFRRIVHPKPDRHGECQISRLLLIVLIMYFGIEITLYLGVWFAVFSEISGRCVYNVGTRSVSYAFSCCVSAHTRLQVCTCALCEPCAWPLTCAIPELALCSVLQCIVYVGLFTLLLSRTLWVALVVAAPH